MRENKINFLTVRCHFRLGGGRSSLQEAKYSVQSRRKQYTTDSLCRKRKLADSIIPCVDPDLDSDISLEELKRSYFI